MVQTVATASIVGMIFSLLISIALPIIGIIVFKKKTKAKISSFFIGAVTFVVFAMVLEQLLHSVVLTAAGATLTGNIWLYAIYGGLAAGLFEETGRFVAMKFIIKKDLNMDNALMYGVGHGGIEAILIVGMAQISNIATSFMINGGQSASIFSSLDDATMTQVSRLWTLPSYQFYLIGIERISAFTLHIALSVLVYLAIKNQKPVYWILAVVLHFIIDAGTVVLSKSISMVLLEVILLVAVAFIAVMVWKLSQRLEKK